MWSVLCIGEASHLCWAYIDDVGCDIPIGVSAVLMEFSMGMWGGGVVEV